jgi:hypothetical protein
MTSYDRNRPAVRLCLLLGAVFSPLVAGAGEAVAPGKVVVEPPTYHCLGFRWYGRGDEDRDARVELAYRKQGAEEWKPAMDLVRLGDWGNDTPLLAGSIIDLEPDTAYECRLTLSDPDGITGEHAGDVTGGRLRRVETVRTRAVAAIPEEMDIRHAYTSEYRGERLEPAFPGLLNAIWGGHMYNRRSPRTRSADSGDMILLHAGVYKGKMFDKRDFRGHLTFASSGWHGYPLGRGDPDGKPLVIKAAGDGEVVIDGSGMPELFDLAGARNVIIEGLTIENCGIAFQLSETRHDRPSANITIRNCILRDVAHVAMGDHPGNRNVTITDCRIHGRQRAVVGSWGSTPSRQAITLNGKGHVFSHNLVVDFFDYVNASGEDVSACDVYNNDCRRIGDNSICFNSGSKNCRALRNRIVNGGDPQLDVRNQVGPSYYIRNVVYNQRSDRGFKNDGGIGGLVALHNTMTLYPLNFHTYNYPRLHNNLFLGDKIKGKLAQAVRTTTGQPASLDHNGYLMSNAAFLLDDKPFASFDAWREASGMEAHGVSVTFSDFVSARSPHGLQRDWPHNVHLIDPETVDLRLREGSPAIDAGAVIPNVNDEFTGDAPDLGAYERGKPMPQYGPRAKFPEPFRMREPEGVTAKDVNLPADPGKAVVRIACGSPAPYQDPRGNVWQADRRYRWPREWGYVGNPMAWHDQIRRGNIEGTALTQLYRFERSDLRSYVIEVPPGRYAVRLHFVERWGKGRVFDVTINNQRVLEDFEIHHAAGGDHKAIHRQFAVDVEGKALTIEFVRKNESNPIINGIEVFRAEP